MDGSGFELTRYDDGHRVCVVVSGDLDLATAEDLDRCLAELADQRRPVLLDLRPLTFMDSSGLRSLMVARERALEEQWPFGIVAPEGDVRHVLRVSGVEEHLPLVEP